MRVIFLLGILYGILSSHPLCAQTGPGGVGNSTSNFLWLKADAGTSTVVDGAAVSSWNDQSGNGNNVSQSSAALRPVFESGIAGLMNNKPLVEFDNDPTNYDYLSVNDNTTLDNFSGFTSFGVFRLRNGAAAGTPRALYSKRVDPSTSYCYSMFHYTSSKMNFDINSSGSGRMASSNSYSTLTDYIVGGSFDPSLASNEQKIFTGSSTNDGQQSNSGSGISNQTSNLHIGALYGHTGTTKQFDGYIGEIIMFNRVVNDAEMRVVNNYLSAKYNIALASNDFYQGDNPASGNYDFEVAGIGQTAAAHTQNQFASSASGGFGMTYVSGFNDGDYVFAGHNVTANMVMTADVAVVSGGPIDVRWKRIWYIDVTNTSTAVSADLVFDLSDGGFPGLTAGPFANYKLLYRATNSGPWTIVATATSVAGDRINFPGYSFASNANDGYYTIATLNNSISPLPIELLSFDAVLNNDHVDLSWATASETNNAFFTVERSQTGENWEDISILNGAGQSNQLIAYADIDPNPLMGRSYYRLRQTDADGNFSHSNVAVVNNDFSQGDFILYPNPAEGGAMNLLFSGFDEGEVKVIITDVQGKEFYSRKHTLSGNVEGLTISPGLSAGTYLVQVFSGKKQLSKKVVVKP